MQLENHQVVTGHYNHWWTSGSDQQLEGHWRWLPSGLPVPHVVWLSDYPTSNTQWNCLVLDFVDD